MRFYLGKLPTKPTARLRVGTSVVFAVLRLMLGGVVEPMSRHAGYPVLIQKRSEWAG